ncbi:hypothetical protein CDD80_5434 [Ophiocordyceps camponoti-rufipedis]|uniref:Uncharacterized protein n=1 Tax=Ophiocordyceps camponoti-rufipedis TaxID=2004952 RepID=A0A2C5XZA8_9HYPO|nr:hypothetical protein CDD80_5434 [Ophiocordyceps camponoti-rufipedis]
MMAALSEADLERLFSGAPQFFARSESYFHGPPHPSVAFPLDEELEIRDLTDHAPIGHGAWSGLTAWPHLPRAVAGGRSQSGRAHFHVRCRERPNMLSTQGLERGTVGYQAALELATADALDENQSALRYVDVRSAVRAVVEARRSIVSEVGCLRALPESELLDRLRRNGELHRANDLRSRPPADSHGDLFGALLRPVGSVIDKTDPYSLANQVVALLRCLGSPYVWIDFGRVEWRLRIGQVLWARDSGHGDDNDDVDQCADERYWLLLQILVASELLLRLDAITDRVEYGSGSIKVLDVAYFERGATPAVKWSLLLARAWLENIEIVGEEEDMPPSPISDRLASPIMDATTLEHKGPIRTLLHHTIRARQGQRQVDGLIYFAKRLHWPGIEKHAAAISHSAHRAVDDTPAPSRSSTPPSPPAEYHGAWDLSYSPLDVSHGAQTRRRRPVMALHESGWLTRSYVSGLVLPGDVMCHLLMATLLENDGSALARLGPLANLSSGFVYSGKSFWSTSCVVGRVLAAGEGVAECMGWISTDVIPQGKGDGWIGIEVITNAVAAQVGKNARLWAKKKLERESSILGDGKEDSVLPADFIIPHEQAHYTSPPPNVTVKLLSLELSQPNASTEATPLSKLLAIRPAEHPNKPLKLRSYTASIDFLLSVQGFEDERLRCCLAYDVSFVTAHPCAPSHRVKILKSPSSPTVQRIDFSASDMLGKGSRSAFRMGHPLHKFYTYTAIHISDLARKPRTTLAEFLAESRVLVVDCVSSAAEMPAASSPAMERISSWPAAAERGPGFQAVGSDVEVLARALFVPYQEPAATGDKADLSSTVATTMPMAAMFTRNKFIGWAAVVFSIQSWLGASEEASKSSGTPGYFTVLMSTMALGVTYLPLVLPPAVSGPAASGTSAPPPVPPR